jgi:LmbE family N-acetylglucosaminyl deacetylase
MTATAPARLVAVSPHLDDLVLSCGRLLACRPGATVITVFSGPRPDWQVVSDWDRICGFAPGIDVSAVRKREDMAALARLCASPRWIDAPEREYRQVEPPRGELIAQLAAEMEGITTETLLIPLGLHHEDHVIAHELALAAAGMAGVVDLVLYADFYHVTLPELLEPRMAQLRSSGLRLQEVRLEQGSIGRKRRAIGRYRSQLAGLPRNVQRWGARAPERYWRVGPVPPPAR